MILTIMTSSVLGVNYIVVYHMYIIPQKGISYVVFFLSLTVSEHLIDYPAVFTAYS